MLFLALSVFSSSVINHLFKLAAVRKEPVYGIFVVNYLFASVAGLLRADLSTAADEPAGAVGLAIVLGLLFVGGLLSLRKGVEQLGASAASALSRLAVVVPILVSVLAFGEQAGWVQAAGIALGLVALPLAGRRLPWKSQPAASERTAGETPDAETPANQTAGGAGGLGWGIALFVIFGMNDSILKMRVEMFPQSDAGIFFAIVFGTALLASFALLLVEGVHFDRGVVLIGAGVGVANFGTAYFISLALQALPGYLAYTINSLGIILLVTLSSIVMWNERPARHNLAFLVMAAASIVLVNV